MQKTHITLAVLATAMSAIFASQAVNAELVMSQNGKDSNLTTTTTVQNTVSVGDKTVTTAPVTKTTATKTTAVKATAAKPAVKKSTSTNYKIDPSHANARFNIDHFGTTTNYGGFYGLTGDLQFDPAKKTGAVDVIIPINSLDTGIEHFTNHLKSADFFNAEKYPTAEFKSTKFYFNGDKVSKVTGNLTMLGKTNPVTLTASKFNCYQSPMLNAKVCGGDFETTIDRTQWGIDGMVKMGMSKNVNLKIQIEAAQQ